MLPFKRSRRYQGEDYRGYIASKKRYFYGLRLHLVVTATGEPVECFLTPGADSDTGALQWYQFDLPAGSKILGDKAFNVYAIEDDLASIGIADPGGNLARNSPIMRSRSNTSNRPRSKIITELLATVLQLGNALKAHTYMHEMFIPGHNSLNIEFLHDHHRRKIRERDIRFVEKFLAQPVGVSKATGRNPF